MTRILFLFFAILTQSAPFGLGADLVIPNGDLNRGLQKGPNNLKILLSKHLEMYPGSLPHDRIFFMTNLDRLAYEREKLAQRLWEMPQYQKDMALRGGMFDFTIRVTEDSSFRAKEFDPRELNALSLAMGELLENQPKDQKDQIFAYLTQVIVDNHRSDLDDFEYNWKRYNSERIQLFEKALIAYVMAYGLLDSGRGQDALEKPISLEEGHIDYLAEEKLWREALEKVANRLKKKNRAPFMIRAEKVLYRWERELKGSDREERVKTVQLKTGDTLHVFEVHPDLAVLRGFVGNDCSTSVSFGFPYSPYERTYYVTDSEYRFLGYIALSLVEFQGERSIFFHTIAGPNITHAMADMLVRGFYQMRETIGGKTLLLPEDHRISENINFFPIDDIMKKYGRRAQAERVTWLDRDYRGIIGSMGSQMFYDDPNRNHSGRAINVDTADLTITTSTRPLESPIMKPLPPVFSPDLCNKQLGLLSDSNAP